MEPGNETGGKDRGFRSFAARWQRREVGGGDGGGGRWGGWRGKEVGGMEGEGGGGGWRGREGQRPTNKESIPFVLPFVLPNN